MLKLNLTFDMNKTDEKWHVAKIFVIYVVLCKWHWMHKRWFTQLLRANSEAPVQRASWSRYRRRRRKHQIQILKFPQVCHQLFIPSRSFHWRRQCGLFFPSCRSSVVTTDSIPPVTFSVSLSLLLLLSKKAKVLPQLDFSATIKAKRRAVERDDDGERENDAEESTQALFSCSSIYQFVTYRNTCHAGLIKVEICCICWNIELWRFWISF